MKKSLSIILLLLMALQLTNALDSEIKWRNDMYRFGIGSNMDDGMTGGMDFRISGLLGGWGLKYSSESYTNRGAESQGEVVQSRIDKMTVTADYLFEYYKNNFTLKIDVGAGVDLVGDLGLESVQNLIHDTLSICSARFPYDSSDVEMRPTCFISATLLKDVGVVGSSDVKFVSNFSFKPSFFITTLSSDMGISVGDICHASVGYNLSKNNSIYLTPRVYSSMTNGVYIDFGLDTGVFDLGYTYYPTSKEGYGCGYLSIDLVEFFTESTYQNKDVSVKTRLFWQYGHKGYGNAVGYSVRDNFSVEFKESYSTGFTLNEYEDCGSCRNTCKRNYTLMTINGLTSRSIYDWISIYGEVGLGVGVYNFKTVDYSRNTVERDLISEISPIADVEVGVVILPEELLTFGCSTFQLNLFYGVSTIFKGEKVCRAFEESQLYLDNSPYFRSYYGVGLNMNIDF